VNIEFTDGMCTYVSHRSEVRVASPRTTPSSYINARKVTIAFAAQKTYLVVPSILFVLSKKSNLPFGHILQLKLLEQFTDGLLIRSCRIFPMLLLDFRDDLIDDSLRHRVAFDRRNGTRDL